MKNPPSTYAAILGNSRCLCVLSRTGLPINLFWPNIDCGQHIDQFRVGVLLEGRRKPLWLDDAGWVHSQSHLNGTNIVETYSEHSREKISVSARAFAATGDDFLCFTYQVTNSRNKPRRIQFCLYSVLRIDESAYDNTALFDEQAGTLLVYRRDVAIGISASKDASAFQCGVIGEPSSAFDEIETGALSGDKIQHKAPDGAVIWDLGEVGAAEAVDLDLFVVPSESLRGVLEESARVRSRGALLALSQTVAFWTEWVDRTSPPLDADKKQADDSTAKGGEELGGAGHSDEHPIEDSSFMEGLRKECGSRAARVYLRSLLSLKLFSDRTGGIIAAPEFDRDREVCGGYGYVWPRDGAFNAHALDLAGKHAEARAYFNWAKKVQEPAGVWLHRYYCSGRLAPSWGLVQIDETGAMIWSMVQHDHLTRNGDDRTFLEESWNSIERAANYLVGALDQQTGLPAPSFDLWEEDISESVYAAAATVGGLDAAAAAADALGHNEQGREWAKVSSEIRSAIVAELWDGKTKLFRRSVKKRVSEPAYAKLSRSDRNEYRPDDSSQGMYPSYVQSYDGRADSSMLGLVFPFRAIEPADPMMGAAVAGLRRKLWSKKTGGLMRYEEDRYIGGNPWILTTLWLAIYYLEVGERKQAVKLIRWAAQHATSMDLLSEQVDRKAGEPAWAVPLGWSHAMFIIAARKLIATG